MTSNEPTRLSEIDGLHAPNLAPRTIRFSQANIRLFQQLWLQSFPGHKPKERGGTLFADKDGGLHLQNIGGISSNATEMMPNLISRQPDRYRAVGVFHTHPYGRNDGWATGVSFSGLDVAYLINQRLNIIVAQSGPRLFALVRTSISPTAINARFYHGFKTGALFAQIDKGSTPQQASRVVANAMAVENGLAYYQGSHQAVTRVYPA